MGTFPFPVPDTSVVMPTPRLRLKPRLPPTTMVDTTATATPLTDTDITDTVWDITVVITVWDSIPVLVPTPAEPPHSSQDLPKVLASKRSLPSSRNLRAMLRYMLYTFRMHQIMAQNKNK